MTQINKAETGMAERRSGPGKFMLNWKKWSSLAAARVAIVMLLGSATAVQAVAETGGYIVFDVASGDVYAKHNADQAWYPASITKLMTTYVVFQMIKAGKLSFSSPVVVSATAAKQPPSKMGFPVGTVITIDNALKMIMVKSANDIAWAIGESVGGSKEAFVGLMNDYARRLGMTETVWDNPNGLPDANQMTTAHDMGLLARALLREFPSYDYYFKLPGIQLGNRVIRNHNHLLDHYPGSDGMKTGYICASGFNVVASATRGGHRMIAVVLGSHNARARSELAADLFNHAFDSAGSTHFFGLGGPTDSLDSYHPGPEANQPVRDIHAEICGGKRDTGSEELLDDPADQAAAPAEARHGGAANATTAHAAHAELLTQHFDIGPPVKVWLGGADSLKTSADPMSVPNQDVAPMAPVPPRAQVAPKLRAPGAILPLAKTGPDQSSTTANPDPQPGAQQETPIGRAFALFPQTQDAPIRQSDASPVAVAPSDAPVMQSLKVPVPKERPPLKVRSASAEHRKPGKPLKPAKPNSQNTPDAVN